VSGWSLIVELHLQEKLSVEIVWLDINLSSELDNVSQDHQLLSIPNEEGFSVERVGLLCNIWLYQPVERNFLGTRIFVLRKLRVFTLVVVRIRIVHFLLVFVEDLVLYEVNTLLDEVHISEML